MMDPPAYQQMAGIEEGEVMDTEDYKKAEWRDIIIRPTRDKNRNRTP